MDAIPYFFPFFFIGMWVFVTYILSKMGWSDLVENFKLERSFSGRRIGYISASINSVNYQNSLILKCNEEGMYINSVIFFRLFHPAIFIPWSEIIDVRDKKILFTSYKELIIGNPFIATIKLRNKPYNKLRPEFEK